VSTVQTVEGACATGFTFTWRTAMESTTDPTPSRPPGLFEMYEPVRHARRRGLLVGIGLGLLPLLVTLTPFWNNYLHTGDDRDLGWHVRPFVLQTRAREQGLVCTRLGESIYRHQFLWSDDFDPTEGYATPAQKAFYAACMGSRGGYGGD
jgi:hypothetical protein